MQQTTDRIVVWTANGTPTRLVWQGRRYRVNDRPTPLEGLHPAITHPPAGAAGWRFQARADDGEVLVFDVRETRGGWELIRVYE